MRRIPFLSNSDGKAIQVICWVAVIGILVAGALSRGKAVTPNEEGAEKTDFSNSAKQKNRVFRYNEQDEVVETFPFDPNTADSTTLLRLGLAPWQVRSIYRYRAKHGRYHTAEEFKRLPGMTRELWDRLGPQVRIDAKYQYLSEKERNAAVAQHHSPVDSVCQPVAVKPEKKDSFVRREKYSPGTVVDVNTADTTELMKIPLIGSKRAAQIVAYRQKLGGFVRVEQVMESCQLPDEVLEWFVVAPCDVHRINVNKASVQQMMRHPYISFYKARDIFEYRRRNGSFSSAKDLVSCGLLTRDELEKLEAYLEF